jgi:hypothetical protein
MVIVGCVLHLFIQYIFWGLLCGAFAVGQLDTCTVDQLEIHIGVFERHIENVALDYGIMEFQDILYGGGQTLRMVNEFGHFELPRCAHGIFQNFTKATSVVGWHIYYANL